MRYIRCYQCKEVARHTPERGEGPSRFTIVNYYTCGACGAKATPKTPGDVKGPNIFGEFERWDTERLTSPGI